MTKETWEFWADEYQEYYEDDTPVYPDDLEEWKEEEQKVIDELRPPATLRHIGEGDTGVNFILGFVFVPLMLLALSVMVYTGAFTVNDTMPIDEEDYK
jgi:hypothetical protein